MNTLLVREIRLAMPKLNIKINVIFFTFMVISMLIYEDFGHKKLIEYLDFSHTFYIAGYLVSHNLTENLYLNPSNPDFTGDSGFHYYVHKLLPDLSKQMNTFFFYTPATALIFAPLSFLPLWQALFFWQSLSLLALNFSIKKITQAYQLESWNLVYRNILFFPVVITVLTGQVNLCLGILPLSLSYYFLKQKAYYKAGFMLGCTLLKPQYLPIALLVAGSYLLTKNAQVIFGMIVAVISMIIMVCGLIGPKVFATWLFSFKVFDSIFTVNNLAYSRKLISSFIGCFLVTVPDQLRENVRQVIYFLALLLSLSCLYYCHKLLKDNPNNFPYIYILGIFIEPVISPHLLYYDLAIFTLASAIIYSLNNEVLNFKKLILPIWVLINLDAIIIMLVDKAQVIPALIVQIGLLFSYLYTLYRIRQKLLTVAK